MSYTAPSFDAVTGSWVGAISSSNATPGDEVTCTFSITRLTSVAIAPAPIVSSLIGDEVVMTGLSVNLHLHGEIGQTSFHLGKIYAESIHDSNSIDFNGYSGYHEINPLHVDFPDLPFLSNIIARSRISVTSSAWLRTRRYDVPPVVFENVQLECPYQPNDLNRDIILCPLSDKTILYDFSLLDGPLGNLSPVINRLQGSQILSPGPLGEYTSVFSEVTRNIIARTNSPLGERISSLLIDQAIAVRVNGPLGNSIKSLLSIQEMKIALKGPLAESSRILTSNSQRVRIITDGPLGLPAPYISNNNVYFEIQGPLGLPELFFTNNFADIITSGPLGENTSMHADQSCKIKIESVGPLGNVYSSLSNHGIYFKVDGPLGKTSAFLTDLYLSANSDGPLGQSIRIRNELVDNSSLSVEGPIGQTTAFLRNLQVNILVSTPLGECSAFSERPIYSKFSLSGPLTENSLSSLLTNYTVTFKTSGPLGEPSPVTDVKIRTRVETIGPLGNSLDISIYNNQIQMQVDGPLGISSPYIDRLISTRIETRGPLGEPSPIAYNNLVDFITSGPLGECSAHLFKKPRVNVRCPGILSSSSITVMAIIKPIVRMSVSGPLGDASKALISNQFIDALVTGPLSVNSKVLVISPNRARLKVLGPLSQSKPKAYAEVPELVLVNSKISGVLSSTIKAHVGILPKAHIQTPGPLSLSNAWAFISKNDFQFINSCGEFLFAKLYAPSIDGPLEPTGLVDPNDDVHFDAYFFDDVILENEYIDPEDESGEMMIIALDHLPYSHKLKVCYPGEKKFKFEFVSGLLPDGLTFSETGCITGVIKELDTMKYNDGLPSSSLWYYVNPLGEYQAYSRTFRLRIRVNTEKGEYLAEKDFYIRVMNNWSCDTAKMLRNIENLTAAPISEITDGQFIIRPTLAPSIQKISLCPCPNDPIVERVEDAGPFVIPSDNSLPGIDNEIASIKFRRGVDLEVEIIFRGGESMELEFNHEGR